MISQAKTNTVTMTGDDLLTAITDYLFKQDIEGNIDNLSSVTIINSGILESDISGAATIDTSVAAVAIIIPLP